MDTGLEKIMTVEIINQRPDPEPVLYGAQYRKALEEHGNTAMGLIAS